MTLCLWLPCPTWLLQAACREHSYRYISMYNSMLVGEQMLVMTWYLWVCLSGQWMTGGESSSSVGCWWICSCNFSSLCLIVQMYASQCFRYQQQTTAVLVAEKDYPYHLSKHSIFLLPIFCISKFPYMYFSFYNYFEGREGLPLPSLTFLNTLAFSILCFLCTIPYTYFSVAAVLSSS